MPGRHKIALFGIGNIGRIIYSGTAALTLPAEIKKEESNFNFDSLITKRADNTTLIKAYKKVQRKYYPEKDLLIKKEKGEI